MPLSPVREDRVEACFWRVSVKTNEPATNAVPSTTEMHRQCQPDLVRRQVAQRHLAHRALDVDAIGQTAASDARA